MRGRKEEVKEGNKRRVYWKYNRVLIIVVQLISHVQLFVTVWIVACQPPLSFTIFQSLLKLCPLSRWCHLTISSSVTLFFPPFSIFPRTRVFSSESVLCIRWSKVLELQHQSFQWIFRVDFLWDWLVRSPYCPRESQESSLAHFESISLWHSALWSKSHISTWLLEKP